jgi:hypothetical protein
MLEKKLMWSLAAHAPQGGTVHARFRDCPHAGSRFERRMRRSTRPRMRGLEAGPHAGLPAMPRAAWPTTSALSVMRRRRHRARV